MLDADLLGQGLRPGDLVIFFAEIKSDGKGFLTLKIRRDIRGIDAGREEATHFDIRDLMRLNAVLKDLLDLVDGLILGHLQIGLELGLKITLCLDNAVAEPHEVTRQEALDVLEEGHRLRHILERQVSVQRLVVEALGEVRMLQNTLDL